MDQPSNSHPGVREPRENRGRLRHCNGLQTPIATVSKREGGSEVYARSQDIGLVVLVVVFGRPYCVAHALTSPFKRRMRPDQPACAGGTSLSAFILDLTGGGGFFVIGLLLRAGLWLKTRWNNIPANRKISKCSNSVFVSVAPLSPVLQWPMQLTRSTRRK